MSNERAQPYPIRVYSADKTYFAKLALDEFENQQSAFKTLCETYRKSKEAPQANPDNSINLEKYNQDIEEHKKQIEVLQSELETLKNQTPEENTELIEANKNLTLQVEELQSQLDALKTEIKPQVEITAANLTNLRKIRPFAVKRGIFEGEGREKLTDSNYVPRMVNLAVTYLIDQEFKQYIKK